MKRMIVLSIILSLSTGYSNIRVGRTGGGLSEMKAYSVVEQISSLVKICTAPQARCGLDARQKNDLIVLSRTMNLERLSLVAPWSGPSRLSGLTIHLNSQDIYTSGVPHKYGQILSLCLYLLLRDGLHLNERVSRWPYQIFSSFQEKMRSLDIPDFGFTLHSFSLALPRSGGNMIQSLALEKEKVTEDWTKELLTNIDCPGATWSIEAWSYIPGQNWVRAQILWDCGSHQWSGELQLQISSQGISDLAIVRRSQLM